LPSGWRTRIRERLSPRLPRTEVLVIIGVCLVAFVVTLVVMTSSVGARARRAAEAAREEAQEDMAREKPLVDTDDISVTAEDFLLPTFTPAPVHPAYVPYRTPTAKWSREMVEKYWVPPRSIALEIVQSMNDRAVERLFQDVQ
jgi:hypothetical protein